MSLIPILLAMAAQAAEVPAQPAAEAGEPDVKVTCRTERVTGSRVVKRNCRSPQQQRQADLDARTKLRMEGRRENSPAFKPPTGQ